MNKPTWSPMCHELDDVSWSTRFRMISHEAHLKEVQGLKQNQVDLDTPKSHPALYLPWLKSKALI